MVAKWESKFQAFLAKTLETGDENSKASESYACTRNLLLASLKFSKYFEKDQHLETSPIHLQPVPFRLQIVVFSVFEGHKGQDTKIVDENSVEQ